MTDLVSTIVDGRVTTVRYNHARRGNCFSAERLAGLVGALELAAGRPDCSVVRLDMAGRHFCAGWDVDDFGALSASSPGAVAAALEATDLALDRIRALDVPVVAGVRGHVVGFGVGLLDAVHFAVAADDVEVSMPEVRFGFAPAGVARTLAARLPAKAALALVTGVRTAGAQQLRAWGLVNDVVAGGDLDEAVARLVEALAGASRELMRAVLAVTRTAADETRRPDAYRISAETIVGSLPADSSGRTP